MTSPEPLPPSAPPSILRIDPWLDPVIDRLGYDPRSAYVESFWLSILGPSSTWLLRHVAWRFDVAPDGFELDMADAARQLGLGAARGRHSPFRRSFDRCQQFGLAHVGEGSCLIRRRLPPLTAGQVRRLPVAVQREHRRWVDAGAADHAERDELHQRARRIALTLMELGEDVSAVERQLHLWKFHPDTSRDAAVWAAQRAHRAVGSPTSMASNPD